MGVCPVPVRAGAAKILGMATSHNLPAEPGAAPIGCLTPGVVTPMRTVPADIVRPEYVGKKTPNEGNDSNMYTPEEVERVRAAGKVAAGAIVEAAKIAVPGTTTDQIDVLIHEYICDHGAYPSTLDYRGYPKSVCTSLNEVICHGIPDSTVLEDGDILNLDVTAYLDGMHGDTNKTLLVGNVDEESRLLVERTEEALNRLHLPKTVLRLKITPDPKQLASFRRILPAGCSGTAEMRVGKVACSIELLGK